MFATIRRYDAVDKDHIDELVKKADETLVPSLSELPGFNGYFLIEAGNGIMSSIGFFDTAEHADESARVATSGCASRSSRTYCRTRRRSPPARSSCRGQQSSSRRKPRAVRCRTGRPACFAGLLAFGRRTMRKLIVSEFVTLDGVMEAPGGEDGHPHSGLGVRLREPGAGAVQARGGHGGRRAAARQGDLRGLRRGLAGAGRPVRGQDERDAQVRGLDDARGPGVEQHERDAGREARWPG